MVQFVETKEEFDAILKDNALVAVDFTASWCGPCKVIGPKFEALDGSYPTIMFFKVDVDKNSDTAEFYGVQAMPTFKFFKDGKEVAEVVGASEKKISEALDRLKAM